MLQQEVRAGFTASSSSSANLQVEVCALRTDVQILGQKLVCNGAADEIAMAVQQSAQKALPHSFFFGSLSSLLGIRAFPIKSKGTGRHYRISAAFGFCSMT